MSYDASSDAVMTQGGGKRRRRAPASDRGPTRGERRQKGIQDRRAAEDGTAAPSPVMTEGDAKGPITEGLGADAPWATPAQLEGREARWMPHPGQQAFALAVTGVHELLYGGARGGGKTDAGMAWLIRPPHVHHPRFRGLVIRRNAEDLNDWLARAEYLYGPMGARFVGKPTTIWFPHGACIRTGHLKDADSYERYQGHEYQRVLIEELTQIPTETLYLELLASCRSTLDGLPPEVFCTTNPGGPGHQWVRRRWGIQQDHLPNVAYQKPDGRLIMYVPATVDDNPKLLKADPQYVQFLESLPEPLRSAWRFGDWACFTGQMFAFDPRPGGTHVIAERPIPAHSPLIMSYDWGFGAPASVGWWFVDSDNRLIRFLELYLAQPRSQVGAENKGLRLSDTEQAQRIKVREQQAGISGRKILRLCDPTCFNRKADYGSGGQGPSTAEVFAQEGLILTPGDPRRSSKVRQFHERLRVPRDPETGKRLGDPMLQVFQSCHAFIELIPALQCDPNDPEDVDTNLEDHVYDESALAVMARPLWQGSAGTGSRRRTWL